MAELAGSSASTLLFALVAGCVVAVVTATFADGSHTVGRERRPWQKRSACRLCAKVTEVTGGHNIPASRYATSEPATATFSDRPQ